MPMDRMMMTVSRVTTLFFLLQTLWFANGYLHDSNNPWGVSSRYFTYKTTLPPMSAVAPPPHAFSNNDTITTTTIPYSSYSPQHQQEGLGKEIPVTYTNNPSAVLDWFHNNLPHDSSGGILGFDTESLPKFSRAKSRSNFQNAATVQLATVDSCLVVHLVRGSTSSHSAACLPILKSVLNDREYIKAGCAIDEDMMALSEIWDGLDARSRLDLGFLGKRSASQRIGLKDLTAAVVGLDLPKPKRITLSDWTVVPLTEAQIIYSARDAWAGAAIANKLAESQPTSFGREALVGAFEGEISISHLIERQQRRDKAKRDLGKLLRPYKSKSSLRNLPKPVRRKAKRLRGMIKERVIEPSCVNEMFYDFEI